MITAVFKRDDGTHTLSFEAKGHAQSDEYGRDLICASASILGYTLAQAVLDMSEKLEGEPMIRLSEGDAMISCQTADDADYAEVLNAYCVVQTGFKLLSSNFPQNVKLISW